MRVLILRMWGFIKNSCFRDVPGCPNCSGLQFALHILCKCWTWDSTASNIISISVCLSMKVAVSCLTPWPGTLTINVPCRGVKLVLVIPLASREKTERRNAIPVTDRLRGNLINQLSFLSSKWVISSMLIPGLMSLHRIGASDVREFITYAGQSPNAIESDWDSCQWI